MIDVVDGPEKKPAGPGSILNFALPVDDNDVEVNRMMSCGYLRANGDATHPCKGGEDSWTLAIRLEPPTSGAGERTGPAAASSMGAKPPPGAIPLLAGPTLAGWVKADGTTPADWPYRGGVLTVGPGQGSIMTRRLFGSHRLDVEFLVPKHAEGLPDQARGNSGVDVQGRYEL